VAACPDSHQGCASVRQALPPQADHRKGTTFTVRYTVPYMWYIGAIAQGEGIFKMPMVPVPVWTLLDSKYTLYYVQRRQCCGSEINFFFFSDPDPDPACLTKVIRLYKIKL
jgi:hypothetical protein